MFELMPFGRDKSLSRWFDEMEKNLFGGLDRSIAAFRTDIRDKGDHYLLEAELPGFDKGDIALDVDGDVLTIRAEQSSETDKKEDAFVHKERRYGAYMRRFNLDGICPEQITAEYKHGLLKVRLPKSVPEKKDARRIEISDGQ